MEYKGWTIIPTTEPWAVKYNQLFTYYRGTEPGEDVYTASNLDEAKAEIDEKTDPVPEKGQIWARRNGRGNVQITSVYPGGSVCVKGLNRGEHWGLSLSELHERYTLAIPQPKPIIQ